MFISLITQIKRTEEQVEAINRVMYPACAGDISQTVWEQLLTIKMELKAQLWHMERELAVFEAACAPAVETVSEGEAWEETEERFVVSVYELAA